MLCPGKSDQGRHLSVMSIVWKQWRGQLFGPLMTIGAEADSASWDNTKAEGVPRIFCPKTVPSTLNCLTVNEKGVS